MIKWPILFKVYTFKSLQCKMFIEFKISENEISVHMKFLYAIPRINQENAIFYWMPEYGLDLMEYMFTFSCIISVEINWRHLCLSITRSKIDVVIRFATDSIFQRCILLLFAFLSFFFPFCEHTHSFNWKIGHRGQVSSCTTTFVTFIWMMMMTSEFLNNGTALRAHFKHFRSINFSCN